jgi:hypothetical protein
MVGMLGSGSLLLDWSEISSASHGGTFWIKSEVCFGLFCVELF